MAFAHLHVHTEYSLLDGSNKIQEYVACVKEQGMSAAAITDHGAMYGVIEFYKTIIDSPKITVEFLNPFTGEWKTIYGYRGDRNIQAMFPYLTQDGFVELYSSISQTIIEL